MRHRPFLLTLALILAACNSVSSTTVPSPASMTGTPAITVTNTPAQPAIPTPLPPALPRAPSAVLAYIDFQDANNGWGIAVNENGYILRTVDGGATWLNATPPDLGMIGLSASLFALDVNTVWMLVPGPDFYAASLYHTVDGGISWSSNPVPFGGAYIQFLDGSNGRALADRGAGAGSNAVGLYQTSDGGVTWVSLFHNDPTLPGWSDSLPLSGIKNGMYFLNASTGWVTGSVPAAGDVYFYVTHDGGISWSRQGIPLPVGYETYLYMAHGPIFFGQDGYLPLTVYLPTTTGLTFYTTHDGGATWTGDPGNANKVITPGRYSFADALHAWSWDGGPVLYSTSDGAQTWNALPTSLDLSGKLGQLQFVPSTTDSFVGWALTGIDETDHSQLYITRDNGAAWTPVLP